MGKEDVDMDVVNRGSQRNHIPLELELQAAVLHLTRVLRTRLGSATLNRGLSLAPNSVFLTLWFGKIWCAA